MRFEIVTDYVEAPNVSLDNDDPTLRAVAFVDPVGRNK
jgi:hypothetical protein